MHGSKRRTNRRRQNLDHKGPPSSTFTDGKKFDSDKVICCVRNPLDVILSFASLSNTMSHSANPEFDYATDYPEWWAWWVKT